MTDFDRIYNRLSTLIRRHRWLMLPLFVGGWGVMILWAIFGLVWLGAAGPLPTGDTLSQHANPVATEVLAVDGSLLGKYYLQDRKPVGPHEIAPAVIEALIATEDTRFYAHNGLDQQSWWRVLIRGLIMRDPNAGGGSTITQQLAKNLYPRRSYPALSLLINKFREIIIARRLEQHFTKSEILTRYLNTVSFGENAFGIETAAYRFFGKGADSLKIEEAAMLIGMLKGVSIYNPRRHPDWSIQRRNAVLSRMALVYPSVYAAHKDSLQSLPVALDFRYKNHHEGPAPYFLAWLRAGMEAWCAAHPKWKGGQWNPYTDGLRITTTLDPQLQAYAEAAVARQMQRIQQNYQKEWRRKGLSAPQEALLQAALPRSPQVQAWGQAGFDSLQIDSMSRLPKPTALPNLITGAVDSLELSLRDSLAIQLFRMQCGFVAIDPYTGHVKAWVGGFNHQRFQYDHVTSERQSGSVFKPLVYAAALEAGLSPCAYISNEKTEFARYDNWTPRNADAEYGGDYSMQGALTHSVNVATVNLLMEIGPRKVVEIGKALGLKADLPAVPSLALGTAEVSLLDMTAAYGSIFNGGLALSPITMLRIEDAEGHLLDSFEGLYPRDSVLSSSTSSMMTMMLENVVAQGTARSLRSRYGLKGALAGKTGTTQDQADGWFIGATPDLVAGAWVGADDRRLHFRSMRYGQGAATALPIWADFMQQVAKGPKGLTAKRRNFLLADPAQRDSLACDNWRIPINPEEFREWYEARLQQEFEDSLRAATDN